MTSLIPRHTGIGDLFRILEEGLPFSARHLVKVEDYRDNGDYVLRAELPGVDPAKDIDIQVDGDTLTINAERTTSRHDNSRSEFSYGSFARTVRLPAGTDPGKITASYDAGILQVRVPVVPAAEPKRIAVETEKG